MRFTSILKKLLGVTQLYVRGIAMDRADEILVAVTPTWRKPRCAECGRRAAQYDHPTSVGRWQDLNWGPIRVWLGHCQLGLLLAELPHAQLPRIPVSTRHHQPRGVALSSASRSASETWRTCWPAAVRFFRT